MKGLEAGDMAEVADAIIIFRISKTHKSDTKKLQICITDNDVMKVTHTALVKQGAELKAGTPPKTELRRTIQTALDRMEDE